MTDTETAEFRVEAEGVPLAIDQLENLLRKVASEGERGGVDVTVTRVQDEPDRDGFTKANE